MQIISAIGIDLAKTVFQLHAVNRAEKKLWSRKVSRSQLLRVLREIPPCRVFMEACSSSHFWARQFQELGHEVKLIAGQHVKKFVAGNKNDAIDAEAIVVCGLRPQTRFVPVKSEVQLRQQFSHRIRSRLVRERTALCNEMRSLLYEHGIVVAKTRRKLVNELKDFISKDILQPELRVMLEELLGEYHTKEERIQSYESKIHQSFSDDPRRKLLEQVPGIGPLTATALLTEIGNGSEFTNGRHLAAFLGLVPRHSGSGGKNRNHSISKRGDCYLRTLLIHGARSRLRFTHLGRDRLRRWSEKLKQRTGANKAAVALANKNARIVWKILTSGEAFNASLAA